MSEPWIIAAYSASGELLRPLLWPWLTWRRLHGKELAHRLDERRGRTAARRPDGPLIWLHAASIGESFSATPVIETLCARGASLVMTTGTVSSATALSARLPVRAIHQFAPLDVGTWVTRFLDHWRPQLALRIESELWPNTIFELARRRIPQLVINARLSDRAVRGWRRTPDFASAIFGRLTEVAAQSQHDAEAFRNLGAPKVTVTGNIKFAAPILQPGPAALAILTRTIGDRPRWLAASIHPGEDDIVAAAHTYAAANTPGLISIVVPRHPDRATAMAATFAARGLKVARRSLNETPDKSTDIYIADTMGELGTFYRLCPIVFIGKSFTVGGGQNPIEPAQLGCALLWGPDMSNFRDVAADFARAGAAVEVGNARMLGDHIARLMRDLASAAALTAAATRLIAANTSALERTLETIEPYLEAAGIR